MVWHTLESVTPSAPVKLRWTGLSRTPSGARSFCLRDSVPHRNLSPSAAGQGLPHSQRLSPAPVFGHGKPSTDEY
jgi:hypothetical protein